MRSVETSAKTREEAIRTALRELGVERHEVAVEILDEGSRGLLGFGARDVRVRVTAENLPDLAPKSEGARRPERPARADRPERPERTDRQGRPDRQGREDRGSGDRGERGARRGGRGGTEARDGAAPQDAAQRESRPPRPERGRDAQREQQPQERQERSARPRSEEDQEQSERGERRSRGRRGGRGRSSQPQDQREERQGMQSQPAGRDARDGEAARRQHGEGRSRPDRGRGSDASRHRVERDEESESRRGRRERDDAYEHLRARSKRDAVVDAPEQDVTAMDAEPRSPAPRLSEAEVASAASLLSEMVAKCGMEATVTSKVSDDGEVTLVVDSPDSALLIGRKGRNLEAMQYLLNRMIQSGETGEFPERILIDIEGYLDRRRTGLEEMAHRLADKARETGRRIRVKPLSPQERRIIHLTLENDPDVRTFSVGAAPSRCVVIAPKNERERPRRGGSGRRNGRSRRGADDRVAAEVSPNGEADADLARPDVGDDGDE